MRMQMRICCAAKITSYFGYLKLNSRKQTSSEYLKSLWLFSKTPQIILESDQNKTFDRILSKLIQQISE